MCNVVLSAKDTTLKKKNVLDYALSLGGMTHRSTS